jgi:predicted nuclease of restriction endonuclease-like RecB superfamily
MLTSDLIRVRTQKQEIFPRYVDPSRPHIRGKAEALIELFEEHVGQTRGELEEAIGVTIGASTDFMMQRGFCKLLFDRSDFNVNSRIDPRDLRRRLFETTAANYPVVTTPDLVHTVTRHDVMSTVGEEFEMSVEEVEEAMYADLPDSHRLKSFDSIDVDGLLNRYNLALAQAVLYKATTLWVELHNTQVKRLRQLVRYLKFFKLIGHIKKKKYGYELRIDGPMSLFSKSQKYGLQMALFLPALLLCGDWKMEAEVKWENQRKLYRFSLDPSQGLVSHYPDKGVYVTKEEEYFRKRWDADKLGWDLKPQSRVMQLGPKDIGFSDYVLKRKSDGAEVMLEVVGFWNRASMNKKMELLQEYGDDSLIVAVPERLRVSQEKWQEVPGAVYFFKEVIMPKRIIEHAEKLAGETSDPNSLL